RLSRLLPLGCDLARRVAQARVDRPRAAFRLRGRLEEVRAAVGLADPHAPRFPRNAGARVGARPLRTASGGTGRAARAASAIHAKGVKLPHHVGTFGKRTRKDSRSRGSRRTIVVTSTGDDARPLCAWGGAMTDHYLLGVVSLYGVTSLG